MSRHIVAYEGKAPFPGTFIEKGALKPRLNNRIPVYTRSDIPMALAVAKDMERDDATGAISFEIEFREPTVISEEDSFSVYANPVQDFMRDGIRVVYDGIIVGIQWIPFGGIPRAVAKELAGNT